MSVKYKDDLGEEIVCRNCDVTLEEWEQYASGDQHQHQWFCGSVWYCSDDCYYEYTKDEG